MLANEPCSCRETFTDALEGEAPRLRPDAAVRSRITHAPWTVSGLWMEVSLEDGTRPTNTNVTGRLWDITPGPGTLLALEDRDANVSTLRTNRKSGGRR